MGGSRFVVFDLGEEQYTRTVGGGGGLNLYSGGEWSFTGFFCGASLSEISKRYQSPSNCFFLASNSSWVMIPASRSSLNFLSSSAVFVIAVGTEV